MSAHNIGYIDIFEEEECAWGDLILTGLELLMPPEPEPVHVPCCHCRNVVTLEMGTQTDEASPVVEPMEEPAEEMKKIPRKRLHLRKGIECVGKRQRFRYMAEERAQMTPEEKAVAMQKKKEKEMEKEKKKMEKKKKAMEKAVERKKREAVKRENAKKKAAEKEKKKAANKVKRRIKENERQRKRRKAERAEKIVHDFVFGPSCD